MAKRIDARRADTSKPPIPAPGANPIDHVPYAVKHKIDLADTVVQALLIDGGNDEFAGDVVDYLVRYGVIDQTREYQRHLSVMLSHYHADHFNGVRGVLRQANPAKTGTGHRRPPGSAAHPTPPRSSRRLPHGSRPDTTNHNRDSAEPGPRGLLGAAACPVTLRVAGPS
ncbi:hypothetical protein [Embleya sp. MST-111070]|uniref:hypothetical protein n=1 Tax=Embleya sp. MST-111070 TaxID=3398231 RepID=UPI003F73B1E7